MYTTLKRYTQKKILYRIYKGMYTTLPLDHVNPLALGIKALHQYAYVSCETVLSQHGFINSAVKDMTLVSSKSRCFSIGNETYRSRRLQDRFLFHPFGIEVRDEVRMAIKERAIVDMLYFNPEFHFDRPIDWDIIERVQKNIGYSLTRDRYAPTSSKGCRS
ncbi:MAG: hypothetical protein HYS07_03895 [Chlamydiae bacterium]|nr:hypothetical protein [Chlamydiota bacterium]